MYKPIVSLETGIIRGYAVRSNSEVDFDQYKNQKIFYIPVLEEVEKEIKAIKEIKALDHERIVVVLQESEILNYEKNIDDLIETIRESGFGAALRIGFYEYPDVVQIKRWKLSFVLIEKNIISNLDANPELAGKIRSVLLFGKEMNFSVIAEGIQTERNLQNAVNLGIPYGRGKLLQCGKNSGSSLPSGLLQLLKNSNQNKRNEYQNMSLVRNVSSISRNGYVMQLEEKAAAAYELFERDKDGAAICVVDTKGKFRGILTKTALMQAFGGRYGYNLHVKKTVKDLSNAKVLTVYKTFSIESVSRLAMERETSELYDPVVVLNRDKYYGIVTVKDLLSATVSIEVEKANEANPLTSLPGNRVIEQKIHQLIGESEFFAIIYLDLDNFKAFNDAYGFPNGDRMIEILARSMKKAFGTSSFLGHIGGDDFVIISRQPNAREQAEIIISDFREKIHELYNDEDWERGYIVSQNRKGITERFPIASISIAIVTNQITRYNKAAELTEQIVKAKKKAKQIEGNSIVVL